MDRHHGNRHRIWRLLTHPAIELLVTILLAMVVTWYLVESAPPDPLPLFGRH